MKEIYKKISSGITKICLPLIVLGSLNSCDNEDNFPKIKAKENYSINFYLDSLLEKTNEGVYLAEKSFNEGIKDGVFTLNERRKTLNLYNESKSNYEKIKEFGEDIDIKYGVSLDKSSEEMRKLLDNSLPEFTLGLGKSKLEKILNNQGSNIKLEKNHENEKTSRYTLFALAGIIFWAIGMNYHNNKIKYN